MMQKQNEHVPETTHYLLAMLKNDPFELWRILRVAWSTARYRYIKRCAGKRSVIGPGTEIINSANVSIGEGCLLQDSVYMRAGAHGKIIIHDRAAINSFCKLFGHGSIEIGEETQLGPGSLITTTDHNYQHALQTTFKRVTIGKRVWVGANVTILPGISIGDYAVIGAGSVVTKNIPPRSVAVGVPARVIKQIDD